MLECYICRDIESSERLIRPCLCKGTSGFVHLSCLKLLDFSRCPICTCYFFRRLNTEDILSLFFFIPTKYYILYNVYIIFSILPVSLFFYILFTIFIYIFLTILQIFYLFFTIFSTRPNNYENENDIFYKFLFNIIKFELLPFDFFFPIILKSLKVLKIL